MTKRFSVVKRTVKKKAVTGYTGCVAEMSSFQAVDGDMYRAGWFKTKSKPRVKTGLLTDFVLVI